MFSEDRSWVLPVYIVDMTLRRSRVFLNITIPFLFAKMLVSEHSVPDVPAPESGMTIHCNQVGPKCSSLFTYQQAETFCISSRIICVVHEMKAVREGRNKSLQGKLQDLVKEAELHVTYVT